MKATEVIKRDHDAVRELFEEFRQATPERRAEMVPILFDALDAHEKMEDAYFYPELRGVTDNEDMLAELEQEQMAIKAELLAARALPGDKDKRMDALMETVLKHARKEERDVFPQAEKLLSADKLEALGEEMEPESAVASFKE